MAVPTATPGTLKTIERVMGQPDDGSVQNGPLAGSETINQVEQNVNNPDPGAQPQQETPVSGGAR